MRFRPIHCPECGQRATGTVENLSGVAQFLPPDQNGEIEYDGYTEVNWDTQETVTDAKGRTNLTCPDGHEWFARELAPNAKVS